MEKLNLHDRPSDDRQEHGGGASGHNAQSAPAPSPDREHTEGQDAQEQSRDHEKGQGEHLHVHTQNLHHSPLISLLFGAIIIILMDKPWVRLFFMIYGGQVLSGLALIAILDHAFACFFPQEHPVHSWLADLGQEPYRLFNYTRLASFSVFLGTVFFVFVAASWPAVLPPVPTMLSDTLFTVFLMASAGYGAWADLSALTGRLFANGRRA